LFDKIKNVKQKVVPFLFKIPDTTSLQKKAIKERRNRYFTNNKVNNFPPVFRVSLDTLFAAVKKSYLICSCGVK